MAMPTPAPILPHASRRAWTVEEVNTLPDDGNRYEVIDGELFVTPAPSYLHQGVVVDLLMRLKPYCDGLALHCLAAPAAVTFSPRREVQPDLLVLPTIDGRPPRHFGEAGRLVLAVELISPSTVRADRYVKRRLFQSEGVPEYWIVDPAARLVERWRPGDEEPDVLLDTLAWHPREEVAPLMIDLAKSFRAVHGEYAVHGG